MERIYRMDRIALKRRFWGTKEQKEEKVGEVDG